MVLESVHGPVSVDELKGQERPIACSSLYPPENIKMAFLFFFFSIFICVYVPSARKETKILLATAMCHLLLGREFT